MATRAVHSSGHRRAGADRAATTSSHSSGSSTESGRERRRRGKLRMQQQLADAQKRISNLEQQNLCLQRLVQELLPTGPASPELFDVYDIAQGDTASVGCQTDISVDFTKPDIFVRAADIPVCDAEQCAEGLIRSHAIAHADAAAGLDVHTADHAGTVTRDDLGLQPRDVTHTAVPLATVKEQSIAEERFPGGEATVSPTTSLGCLHTTSTRLRNASTDFTTSTLGAHPPQPCAFEATVLSARPDATGTDHQFPKEQCTFRAAEPQCGHSHDDFNSQDLAFSSGPLESESPAWHALNTRQAPDGPNARHRVAPQQASARPDAKVAICSKDFNSQDLAFSPGAFAIDTPAWHMQDTRQPLDGLNPEHRELDNQYPKEQCTPCAAEPQCGHSKDDFNSQDLAFSSRPSEYDSPAWHAQNTRQAPDGPNSRHRGPQHASASPDARAAICTTDYNSQDLATSGPFAIDGPPRHMQNTRQLLGDHNKRREPDSQLPKVQHDHSQNDFNSQDLAFSSGAFESDSQVWHALRTRQAPDESESPAWHALSPRQAPDDPNARHREAMQNTRQPLDGFHSRHRESDNQYLKEQYTPCAAEAEPQCGHSQGDVISQDLAFTSRPSEVDTPAWHAHYTRQAPDGLHSRHRGPRQASAFNDASAAVCSNDFNSQDLALSSGPFAIEAPTRHMQDMRQPLEDLNVEHRELDKTKVGWTPILGPKEQHTQCATEPQCGHSPNASAVDASVDSCLKDYNSQDLASLSGSKEAVTFADNEHMPRQASPELSDDTPKILGPSRDPDCPEHLTQQQYVSALELLAEQHPEFRDHFLLALQKAKRF